MNFNFFGLDLIWLSIFMKRSGESCNYVRYHVEYETEEFGKMHWVIWLHTIDTSSMISTSVARTSPATKLGARLWTRSKRLQECIVLPPISTAATPVGAVTAYRVFLSSRYFFICLTTSDFPDPAGPVKKTLAPDRTVSRILACSQFNSRRSPSLHSLLPPSVR